jgi:hypothetical protein
VLGSATSLSSSGWSSNSTSSSVASGGGPGMVGGERS